MKESQDKSKQQIVEKIRTSTNILITVSNAPSVDALSASIGLAAILNKMDKHATVIFGGQIPPAISFLQPDKVFESNADSLRDFIIALDKEKADHLRYKVEGDVVKIFITPYRTTISEKDLKFSQGEYNVELVLALGVDNKEHLDAAMAAHGQILDNVTIATLSAGEQASQLGSLGWRDENASGLSEMIATVSEDLKTDDKTLLDKQIATALLTGIVAVTDRFSNVRTSSQVMTVAADLMAAGADQQLIAAKLQDNHAINSLPNAAITEKPVAKKSDGLGGLSIPHDEAAEEPKPAEPVEEKTEEKPVEEVKPEEPKIESVKGDVDEDKTESEEPLLGGILSATTDLAAEDAKKQLDAQQNKTILSHSYLETPSVDETAPINSANQPQEDGNVDIFNGTPVMQSTDVVAPINPTEPVAPPAASTLPPLESIPPTVPSEPVVPPVAPVAPSVESTLSPQGGLPLPPPLPDFSNMPAASTLPPEAALPLMPPPASTMPATEPSPVSTLPADPNDPSQFRIPGQQ